MKTLLPLLMLCGSLMLSAHAEDARPFFVRFMEDPFAVPAFAEMDRQKIAQYLGADGIAGGVPLKTGRVDVAKVVSLSPDGLKIVGENGIELLPWETLSTDLATSMGWSPKVQQFYKRLKSTPVKFTDDFSPEKLKTPAEIVAKANTEANASVGRANAKAEIEQNRVVVAVRLSQVLKSGAWLGYGTAPGATEEHKEPICIVGGPGAYVDGDRWSGYLYPCGSYSYSTVGGSEKTIRKYATSAARAYDELQAR